MAMKKVRGGVGDLAWAVAIVSLCCAATPCCSLHPRLLQFDGDGRFKILQVADMHYADGQSTSCLDVLPAQSKGCSDLNTTAFLRRLILAEKPNLIVFTGDNIFGKDASDAARSMDAAFAPAVAYAIPWAAVLGNHDQQSTLPRPDVMRHIASMDHTLSQFNPPPPAADEEAEAEAEEGGSIDGFGNYHLEVAGVQGSALHNTSLLNLYFLDSGDYSTLPRIPGYGWIKASQQSWFRRTSRRLQRDYKRSSTYSHVPAPALAFFHIPLPEYSDLKNFTGVKQEGVACPSVNSGFFTAMVEAGDVKAAFTGHDHINDFCGEANGGIQLCYGGGFGYHAYGKPGWSRRARIVVASLEKTKAGDWRGVKSIRTWKRLDDQTLSTIDEQILWSRTSSRVRRRKKIDGG